MGRRRRFWTVACASSGLLLAGFAAAVSAQEVGLSTVQDQAPILDIKGFSDTAINLDVRDDAVPRFARDAPVDAYISRSPETVELELAAGGGDSPLDIAIAQRAGLGSNSEGEINRQARGAELRVGRGLVERREGSNSGSVYAFVASDNEALTWQPGARSEFGNPGSSLALQNQVQVGDMSAGVAYERNGVQASLAYVEREASTVIGQQTYSQDENFAGVTVTMRR